MKNPYIKNPELFGMDMPLMPLPDINDTNMNTNIIEPLIQGTSLKSELDGLYGHESIKKATQHFTMLSSTSAPQGN